MTGLAVYAMALVAYGLTASPAIGWLDAPELSAAAVSLGVAQSPGHPLVLMLGKLGSLLPVGDLAFRVNLVSAAAAAGAATAVYAAARAALAPMAPRSDRANTALAAALAMVVALSWALWFQGVRAEVYALEAALAIGALGCALAYRESRRARHLAGFALLGAMAAHNHPAIAAAVLVPSFAIIAARRPSPRALGAAAIAGVLGLAALAYLPVRAAQHPVPNFGAPATAEQLLWTISGRAFHQTASAETVSPPAIDALQAVVAIAEALTWPLALLALVGLVAMLRSPERRGAAAALLAVVALAVAIRTALGFDPETPDHHAYLAAAIAAAAILSGAGIVAIAGWVEGRARPPALAMPLAAIAVAAIAPVQLASNLDRASLADASAADELARFKLGDPPPRALLLTAYFETAFQLDALRALEGARPDLAILDRSFLTYPGARAEALHHHPELAELIEAPLRAGVASPIEQLDALVRRRPVMVELHPNVDPALAERLVPTGSFAAYMPRAPARLLAAAEHRERRRAAILESRMHSGSPADAARANLALLWREYLLAEHYCRRGRREAAALALARARRRARDDRTLRALAERCGLGGSP